MTAWLVVNFMISVKGKKTMTEKNPLDVRLDHLRSNLARKCRILSRDMKEIAEKLGSDTPHDNLHLNNLGEVQAQGPRIDAECGRLMGIIEAMRFDRS